MDDLHRKLDQLLARSCAGTCPMCGTCNQHSGQLLAQTKLLEALEKNVAELRAAVDELAHGLEERVEDKMSVPLAALQRRKSLPVRMSGEEVYVHLDRLRDQKLIHGKGQTAVLLEDAEGERSKGQAQPLTVKRDTKEPSPSAPGSAEAESGHKPPNRVKMERAEPTGNQKSTGGAGVELSTNAGPSRMKMQPKIVPQEKTEKMTLPTEKISKVTLPSPKITSLPEKGTPSPAKIMSSPGKDVSTPEKVTSSPAKMEKKEVPPPSKKATPPPKDGPTLMPSKRPPSPTQNQATAKITDVPAPVKATVFPSLQTAPSNQKKSPSSPPTFSNPPKFHVTKFTAPPAVHLQKNSSAGTVSPSLLALPGDEMPPSNHLMKTGQNSYLKVPGPSQNLHPNPQPKSSLSPPQPSAAASFLKQVYSCPDSLHSLQEPPHTAPPSSGEIQIKISPAPERRPSITKTSPRTCLKIIDDVPPQPAPFPHRCVSLRPNPTYDYTVHTRDVLGGGRFGKVHRCTDNKSSLRLAAKIISARSAKEKEAALNEIEVMNQLNHANILQLYDAFESKNQVVLVMECVEGGELFERIVDEGSPLTEVDAMVFVKQLCEGVQYMHHMYVLHLDLKPENILCVNRSSHQVKIIDFGLARRYKPREKLRVSFGTPEFLAPEVVNFDFVSFPTDMWTLGVVTYMLLSGLSPFLGDDDSETLNNVLSINWYFDEETFEHVSDEAKDFISNLLIKERSGRLSATQCLKHPWLNNISEKAKCSNIVLKSQILLRKYMTRRLWKKNYIAVAAANRFKKISSSGSLTSLGV